MQGLVRDAQKRAIGDAEAVTVRSNGRAFHIQCHRTGLAEALHGAGLVAQFPVAIVDGGNCARAHDAFKLVPFKLSNLGHGILKRDLDFGKRRDGDPNGQVVIKDVILAQVGVRKDEVAQGLRVAQTRAVTDHKPRVRAQDGDVVGGGFGVTGTHADVHQCDAAAVFTLEMICRHLGQFGRCLNWTVGVRDLLVARRDKGRVAAVWIAQHGAGVFLKLGHVELVVGEQDVTLEMIGISGGVMGEAGEGLVHALGGEGSERANAISRHIGPVDDVIICCAEVRDIEYIAQGEIGSALLGDCHTCFGCHREM